MFYPKPIDKLAAIVTSTKGVTTKHAILKRKRLYAAAEELQHKQKNVVSVLSLVIIKKIIVFIQKAIVQY